MPYGTTPTTNQTLNVGDIPLGEVYTPSTLANTGLNALQGGPGIADPADATRKYAPVATYTPDGNDVTQGSSGDANTVNTVMGRLTKVRDILLGLLGQQGKASSLSVTVASDQSAIPVSGAFFQATQPISGTIAVSNLPTTQPVSGSVSVSNLPATQTVAGTVTATIDATNATHLANTETATATTSTQTATVATQTTALTAATGTKADAAATDTLSAWSVVALLKGILAKLLGTLTVTGTFWQTTQPVSVASLPLPTGATQESGHIANVDSSTTTVATQTTALNTSTGAKTDTAATDSSSQWSMIALLKGIFSKLLTSIAVTGTFWQATQPISAASLPLPTGASTDATLTGGTQKTKLVDVGGTNAASISAAGALKVDNSGVTQSVSGAITANAGTNLNTSLLAVESGGNLASATTHLTNLDAHTPALGQAGKAASVPVTLASDQPALLVASTASAWTQVYQTTQTAVASWAGSGDLTVQAYTYLSVIINLSAFTGTNVIFKVSKKDSFGNYTTIATGATLTATGIQEFSIGPGMLTNKTMGNLIQVIANGTAVTSMTFTVDVEAR